MKVEKRHYTGLVHAIQNMWRHEGGLKALYRYLPPPSLSYLLPFVCSTHKAWGPTFLRRGLQPTMFGILPYAGINFFTYDTLKWYVPETRMHPSPPAVHSMIASICPLSLRYYSKKLRIAANGDPPPPIPTTLRLAFGAVAGALGQTLTYPLDVVRSLSLLSLPSFLLLTTTMLGAGPKTNANRRTDAGADLFVQVHVDVARHHDHCPDRGLEDAVSRPAHKLHQGGAPRERFLHHQRPHATVDGPQDRRRRRAVITGRICDGRCSLRYILTTSGDVCTAHVACVASSPEQCRVRLRPAIIASSASGARVRRGRWCPRVAGGCVAYAEAALASWPLAFLPGRSMHLGSLMATRSPKEERDTTNEAHRMPMGRVLRVGSIALCVGTASTVARWHAFVGFVVVWIAVRRCCVVVPKIRQEPGWLTDYDSYWISINSSHADVMPTWREKSNHRTCRRKSQIYQSTARWRPPSSLRG